MALWAALLIFFVAGCANLVAIRNFADQSSDIAGYTKLVNYYVNEPREIAKYQPPTQKPDGASQLLRKKQKEALIARHKIIQTYMDALGQLAADEAVVLDKEVAALGKALQDNQFVDKTEAAAFTALGKLVAKAATDAWRQNRLRDIIKNGNQPVQTLVLSVQKIVEKGYAGELETQAVAIEKYYGKIYAESRDPAGKQALMEWKSVHLSTIDSRRKEAAIYAAALGKIASGHQELYNNMDRLDAKDVFVQMTAYARYLRDAKDALESL